ncbi:hypothetical protein [Priestia flexa]|uniref:hypothetical protein n=1 Tax=Priestia flexa TaxID=86664 RepID=UPI00099DDD79|nr:hypothetical protein [Priestia flexa]AQX56261.1 hypothetical protein BC359_19500 [Priestia flexa]
MELDNVLTKYKKLLKKKPDDLLKLATDPFYAGYDLNNGENKLQHVEPYLSLKSFKDLQTKNVMISQYANKKTELLNENTFEPYCGKCEKPMKFKFSVLEDKAWYTCSNQSNHPKILLSTQDLTCVVNRILDKALQELDTSKIIKDSRQYFNNMRKVIHKELSAITRKKEQLRQRIILENDELTNWRDSPTYSELSKLEDMQQQLLKEVNEKEELLLDNKELTMLATEYLLKSKQKNLFSLAPMLVERLDIYPGKINITMSRFDYLKHLNNQYVFKGGNLY